MKAQQISLVQCSFVRLTPWPGVADLFYARLFQLDPTLRPLFKSDLSAQKQELMTLLEFAIANLEQPGEIGRAMQVFCLGCSISRIQKQQYNTVLYAWLWTLEQTLGAEYTLEIKAAWVAFYQFLIQLMQEVQISALEV